MPRINLASSLKVVFAESLTTPSSLPSYLLEVRDKAASLPAVLNLKTAVVMIAAKLTQARQPTQYNPQARAEYIQEPAAKHSSKKAISNRVMPQKA